MPRGWGWWLLATLGLILVWLKVGPDDEVTPLACLVAFFIWLIVAGSMLLIWVHRSRLHQRLPFPLNYLLLSLKWMLVAWGGIAFVYLRMQQFGVAPGLWIAFGPFVIPFVIGLIDYSRRRDSTSSPR